MKLVNKILVYIDDSDAAIAAIQASILLAKQFEAELYGLYVINTKALGDLVKARIFVESEREEYTRELEEDAERYLRLARRLADSKKVAIEAEKVQGTPHSEIRKAVEEKGIDLLVVGVESNRTKSLREELHSDKDMAMKQVTCDVLCIKNEERMERCFETEEEGENHGFGKLNSSNLSRSDYFNFFILIACKFWCYQIAKYSFENKYYQYYFISSIDNIYFNFTFLYSGNL